MTPEISQSDANLQAELDRLTYSAYLLTLDPGKAFSAVARAIDGSLQENTANSDLLERTVQLALEDVLYESGARWDGESSAYDALLYGRSAAINSKAFQSLEDLDGSPILLLDSAPRIAFVLHHLQLLPVLGDGSNIIVISSIGSHAVVGKPGLDNPSILAYASTN